MASIAELVVKITTDVKDAQGGLDEVGSKTSKMGAGIQKAALPAAAALAGLGAAAISAGKAAAEDAQSQAILAKNLENSAGATKAQVAQTEDYISSMAAATGVADDQLRPAMSALVMATGNVTKAQDGLGIALDVAAATGKDVETVSAAMAKAYAGNTASLGKLVPSLDKATLASGDMDAVMAELAATTGGSAAAAADTAAGQMAIMQNAMGEAQEEIGTALLPAMSSLAKVLTVVAKFVQDNSKLVQILAAVVAVLAAGVLALNAAMKVYQATLIVVQVVQKATWLSALGPLALVVLAIGAVIAIVMVLWHRSETFRNIVLGVWNAIRTAATNVASGVANAWNNTMDALVAAVRWARDLVAGIFQGIRGAWDNAVGGIKAAIGGLGAVLAGPFNIMKSAVDAVVSAVQNLIHWLSNIKVPKISLPNIPNPFSAMAPAPATAGVGAPRVARTLSPRAAASSGGTTFIINGAVDPEGTARQIRRILAGHDRRMGVSP